MRVANLFMRAFIVTPLVFAAAGAASAGQHRFGDYLVTVSAEPAVTPVAADYQVTVENAELVITRLTAAYNGTLSNSFVADLDKDGSFEVVVTFSDAEGHDTGIDVYSWNSYLLEPIRLAELDEGQMQGYRGNDEFAVSDGKLLRIFQIYEEVNGTWSATAARRQLRYSFADARWIAE